MIKVRLDGPQGGRWVRLARFTWEQRHGPVPRGQRVAHLDGNPLNDDPANYGLMTPGQVIQMFHRLRPAMSESNRLAIRETTKDRNRLMGRVHRASAARRRGLVAGTPEWEQFMAMPKKQWRRILRTTASSL